MSRFVAAAAVGLGVAQTLAVHALLHGLAAHSGWVSQLLSPGLHSRFAALVLGVSFIASRLAALVLVPAVLAGSLGYLGGYVLSGAFRLGPRSP